MNEITPQDQILNEENKIISSLVEKVTKGVKKQLKGYVKSTQEEINFSVQRVENIISNFNSLVDRTKHISSYLTEIDLMLKESNENKKMLLDMKNMHQELRNRIMDFTLLEIEIKQNLSLLKAKHNE